MNITQSRFFCVECGNEGIPIVRKIGGQREEGHLKRLYCIHCKKRVNHAEIRSVDGDYDESQFKLEFKLGRFVNEQRIPLSECLDCTHEECEYNINNKCWNCNNSFNCDFKKEKSDNNETIIFNDAESQDLENQPG